MQNSPISTPQEQLFVRLAESPVVSSHDVVLAITEVHRTASDVAAVPDDRERRQLANAALERAVTLFRAHCAQAATEQFKKLQPRLQGSVHGA